MMEMLSYGFMQRALAASLLAGILCSCVAVLVVLKRIAFIGVGISHSAFAGVALGLLMGVDPLLSAAVFAVLVALLIGGITRHTVIGEDTAIGILFSSSMALGVVLLGFVSGNPGDLFGFLFGNILAVSWRDALWLALVSVVVLLFLFLFSKELVFICFDEEVARASGVPVGPLYFAVLASVALTVVVSMRVVGVILVVALIVIPGAIGLEVSRTYRGMVLTSVGAGIGACAGGLVLSYMWNLPSGGTIVLLAALLFGLASILNRRLLGAKAQAPPA